MKVLRNLRDVFRPHGSQDPWAWVEENVRLPHSQQTERVTREHAPWIVKPTCLALDRRFREITVLGAVQGSKSTIGEIVMQHLPTFWPELTWLNYQNDDAAKRVAEERLAPMFQKSPATRNMLAEGRYAVREGAVRFHNMKLRIQGCTEGNLQSGSVPTVINEEVWQWANIGRLEQARKRLTAVLKMPPLMLNLSQGSIVGDALDLAFMEGHQDDWQWTCPECQKRGRNGLQPYLFSPPIDSSGNYGPGGVKWEVTETRGIARIERAMASCYRECAICETRYPDTLAVRREHSEGGQYVQQNPSPLPGLYSCRWHALAVYWIPVSALVREWLTGVDYFKRTGHNDLIKLFRQQREALAFSDIRTEGGMAIRGSGYRLTDYAKGESVEGEVTRIMGVDVQLDHYWVIIVSARAEGTFRVIYAGKVEHKANLGYLADLYKVSPTHVVVDCRYHKPDVLVMCADHAAGPPKRMMRGGGWQWGIWGWFPMQGQDTREGYFPSRVVQGNIQTRVWKVFSEMIETQTRDGRPIPVCQFAPDNVKRTLRHLLDNGKIEHPDDAPPEYLKHMDDEIEVREVNQRTGKETWHFRSRDPNNPDNHLWDCFVLVVVRAMMMGLITAPEKSDAEYMGKKEDE